MFWEGKISIKSTKRTFFVLLMHMGLNLQLNLQLNLLKVNLSSEYRLWLMNLGVVAEYDPSA